ncbi:MAG: hypothetical protein ACRDKZ_10255 [Actinomycetota bacterium]
MGELVDQLIFFWDAQEPGDDRSAIDYWHERMAWLGVHFPNEEASQLVDMRLQTALDRASERSPDARLTRRERIGNLIEAGTRRALKEAAGSATIPTENDTNALCAERVLVQVAHDLGVPRAEAARMVLDVCGGPAAPTPGVESPIDIIRQVAEQDAPH